ncbi:Histone deacetylase [Mycena indigotica]|uniref:Histone deacetylase n=1 Tax=Mycena indigotica TaxID=2126181 RepID=A0A8H6W457_9AGAR|nr:Histone deacetylase [Mycena indigotica]KAF7298629.1 Histone deacetylase [Mycena indigotica]
MSHRRVAYYYDPDVGAYTFGLHQFLKPHRVKMTHDLVSAYDLLGKLHVLKPKRTSAEALTAFHTDEYIQFLSKVTPETFAELSFGGTRFLVGEDNPPFEGLFEFSSISAGGSIAAAQRVADGAADIAINWAGGLHHAKKSEASGFCYVNDIVLCILELLRSMPRVLYIDIDCHHGDGVEEAFYTTDRVLTCSFHKFGNYFPGTGAQEDRGSGKGHRYAVNIPLNDGISDAAFQSIFEPVVGKILDVYQPSTVVLQCGADSLAGDKLGCFNLSMHGHANCVKWLRAKNIPLVLLGGGGYTVKNVARAWTYETACAVGEEGVIDENPVLPHCESFEWFGPRYRLEVLPSNMEDLNLRDGSLPRVRQRALEQLSELPPAPSVGLQDVPRESLHRHLLPSSDLRSTRDKHMDRELARRMQEASDLANQSDSDDSDSENDSNRDETVPRRRHMSIVTNQYQEQESGGARKRTFFAFAPDPDLRRATTIAGR